MNRSEFISFIEDPEKLNKDHLSAIRNIMTDFPYFSVAHVLYTKALHNERHYEFEKQLKQTALRVPDREVLYRFIHQVPAVVVAEESRTITEEPAAVWVPEPAPVEIAEPETIDVKQEVPVFVELPVEEVTEEEAIVEEPIVEEAEHIATEEIIPETFAEPVAEIKEEIVVDEVKEIPVTEAVIPVAEEIEEAKDKQLTDTNEAHSFMEWLQLKATDPVKELVSFTEVKEEIEEIAEETAEPEEMIIHPDPAMKEELVPENIAQPVSETEEKSNVDQFENILDRFIREKPSISRPKAEFFNPVNMARQSVEEDEELVTETLASLYHKQGNHRKAIRAYEKLCLLYPGKMSYFAALIQKIKAELKD